ncbi:MAG: porin [Rhodocyclaceae bacterium]|nr:porin [Rhodocyclaceae bacterium]
MQKKIIALAVAGLASTAAFAQSNVTIYGIVDAGYLYSTVSGSTASSHQIMSGGLSSSRIGFKGTEDLGNGLKGVFGLEYGLSTDVVGAAGGINNARQNYVGLSGGFGTVLIGGLQTPAKALSDKYDAMGQSIFSVSRTLGDASVAFGTAAGTGVFNVNSINTVSRLNNAVAYVSPNFSGLTASVYGSFGGVSGDNVNTKTADQEGVLGVTVEYANGPFGIAGVYHNLSNIGNPLNGATEFSADEYAILGSFDLKFVKISGSYQMSSVDNATVAAGLRKDQDDQMWQIGATVPVGKGTIHVSYGQAYDDAADNMDNESIGLMYTHGLSKRTTAYAGMNYVTNDSKSSLGNVAGVGSKADESATIYGLGVRHMF